jgi:Ca2+/Na+ antiporter
MNQTRVFTVSNLLTFAAAVEVGTGIVLMSDPAIVVKLLLGVVASAEGRLLGRCFGIALLALGLACWRERHRPESNSHSFRAMLTYNVLIGLYLAYLGTIGHLGGWLLWPGVVVHITVGLLLIWARRNERRSKGGKPVSVSGG